MNSGEIPIISTLRTTDLVEEISIGQGYDADEILRKIFYNKEIGNSYVYKPLKEEAEARQNQTIYRSMREANLPKMSFMKTLRKIGTNGTMTYALAMEDLTQKGNLHLEEFGISQPNDQIAQLISALEDPLQLKQDIMKSIAVLHNNGIVHSHPGMSICVRKDIATGKLVDYKFIDYMGIF